ncbi:family 43 glycosylhydrolase [Zunongwangia mangrovi]|nr:family 43 glycosylhydrolase [Zunongwangia mangrovi]
MDQNTGNPLLPGWFADPTIKKYNGIYYIYATTDNEMLASGAPTVWYSKDFSNWYNYTMEIPSLESVNLRNFWAPDIIHAKDGKYYLYFGNCQAGCNIYGYVSENPTGPWEKLHEDDTPVIKHGYPTEGFPSLDAQFFTDDDGQIYAHWGTWVHYNKGYAVGQLDNTRMDQMFDPAKIPLDQTPAPFEAPYMMKKGEKYILMYSGGSCHDESYNVRYSFAESPYGPFTEGDNNPVLSTNSDGSVHGPGHHSILEEDGDYYIVYHRHDYPMTRGGMARQVAIDKMIFENDSTIKKVNPGHGKMKDLIKVSDVPDDLAFNTKTTASSHYYLNSLEYDYEYRPEFATDKNNATMWKAENNQYPQYLEVDLGEEKHIERIMTNFEFASYYYQYVIKYSLDGEKWKIFADRSSNRVPGSPMIDDNDIEARYLKLEILGTEKTGLLASVWNFQVFNSKFDIPLQLENRASENSPAPISQRKKLIDINFGNIELNDSKRSIKNSGSLGGFFKVEDNVKLKELKGERFFDFNGGKLVFSEPVPEVLNWNGSFTVATWVKNPKVSNQGEFLASWCNRNKIGLANTYNAMVYNSGPYGAAAHLDGHFDMSFNEVPEANEWHYLVLTFDGVVEKMYVDGKLDNSQVMLLSSAIEDAKIIIGASDIGENFTGQMASFGMYDYALNNHEILKSMNKYRPNELISDK